MAKRLDEYSPSAQKRFKAVYAVIGALIVLVLLVAAISAVGGGSDDADQAEAQQRLDDEEALAASPGGAAYVAAFRAAFPVLADGREDRYIGRDGARICLTDLPAGLDVALTRVPGRVERNGVTPDPAQAREIVDLAVQHMCPQSAPAP